MPPAPARRRSRAASGRPRGRRTGETKIVTSTIEGSANRTLDMVAEPAEPAVLSVEEEEGEADDDRREGERQVDEGVHEPLAGEPAAHVESAHAMPKTVFAGTAIAVISSVSLKAFTVSAVECVPGGAEAVLERAVEDEKARASRAGSRSGRRAQRPQPESPSHGHASSCSSGSRRSRAGARTRSRAGRRRPRPPRPGLRSRSGRR